jgi:ribosomal protein S18 acetylase RimI-like enzyme
METPTNFKINEYINLAKNTKAFKKSELEDLSDMLKEFKKFPNIEYGIIESREKTHLEGFILYGISPMSKNTWDIYWISVAKKIQRTGLGKRLIKASEYYIQKLSKTPPSIRIETSSRKTYNSARYLYTSMCYEIRGTLPDFYGPKDDMIIFYKTLGDLNGNDNQ